MDGLCGILMTSVCGFHTSRIGGQAHATGKIVRFPTCYWTCMAVGEQQLSYNHIFCSVQKLGSEQWSSMAGKYDKVS